LEYSQFIYQYLGDTSEVLPWFLQIHVKTMLQDVKTPLRRRLKGRISKILMVIWIGLF